MNIKNNRRRQETIKKIEMVFLEFLENKELSQIKVSDICKKAEINRSTFYANFLDVYDLADKIKERLKNEVNSLFVKDLNLQYSEDDFLKLFEHIKANQSLYFFYFKLGYEDRDRLALNDVYIPADEYSAELVEYHITFFKSGFNAIVKKWLYEGCKESPEQMTDILMHEYRGRFKNGFKMES